MKTVLSLILAIILCLGCLSGCHSAVTPPDTTQFEPAETTIPEETEATAAFASPRELFYAHLQSVVIPEIGLADLSRVSVDTDSFDDEHVPLLEVEGFLGLASASVRDFDGDGTEEMVTFTLQGTDIFNTWTREYIREDMWLTSTVNIQLDLYVIEDGQVAHKATEECLTYIDGYSWGPMAAGLEMYDGIIYIWGKAHTENPSTYGISPFAIYHVENNEFIRDYADGLDWGQISLEQEFMEVWTSGMKINNTPLIDVHASVDRIPGSASKWPDTFGDRLQLNVWLESDWSNWGILNAEAADYTGLRQILENGVDSFEAPELPDNSDWSASTQTNLEEAAHAFAQQVSLSLIDAGSWEDEGVFQATYTLADSSELRLKYNTETGKLIQIMLLSDGSQVSEYWYTYKDLILQHPDLAFDANEIAPMLGECSFMDFASGVEIGNAYILIGQVVSATLNITFN